jgi:hypothetical protein
MTLEVHGEFKLKLLVCLEDVEPAEHWTFVVTRSAAKKLPVLLC